MGNICENACQGTIFEKEPIQEMSMVDKQTIEEKMLLEKAEDGDILLFNSD